MKTVLKMRVSSKMKNNVGDEKDEEEEAEERYRGAQP